MHEALVNCISSHDAQWTDYADSLYDGYKMNFETNISAVSAVLLPNSGKYKLHAKMSMEWSSLLSSDLAVELKPDPKKAQKLQVDYREGCVYIAGELFPG